MKLIDFDNSSVPKESDHTVTHLMGTKPFAAPEILDFSHPLDRADIYSLGCILYYTVYGQSPKDYKPNKTALKNKWLRKIFRHCTASYEARHSDISALKKDLMRALWIPSNPVSAVIHKLPGFRTNKTWKKIVATYFYIALILYTGTILFSVISRGLPLLKQEREELFCIILFITEIVIICDAFHLEERSSKYIYWKITHPILHFLEKFTEAIIIFFIFVLLMTLFYYKK